MRRLLTFVLLALTSRPGTGHVVGSGQEATVRDAVISDTAEPPPFIGGTAINRRGHLVDGGETGLIAASGMWLAPGAG